MRAFVVHKSKRFFPGLAIDQAHEQNNSGIKGDGRAIGLIEDTALWKWMVCGRARSESSHSRI